MLALQDDLSQLVPNARQLVATESGHDIHQDQPELVIDAIREVVEAVVTRAAGRRRLIASRENKRTSRFLTRSIPGSHMILA